MDKTSLAWVFLFIAAAFEAAWAIGLKYSQGFSKLGPTVFTLVTLVLSFAFLCLAVRQLPVGTAYAVWTGIGAATVATFGILVLHEPASALRILSLLMIVCGIIGLKLFSHTH